MLEADHFGRLALIKNDFNVLVLISCAIHICILQTFGSFRIQHRIPDRDLIHACSSIAIHRRLIRNFSSLCTRSDETCHKATKGGITLDEPRQEEPVSRLEKHIQHFGLLQGYDQSQLTQVSSPVLHDIFGKQRLV